MFCLKNRVLFKWIISYLLLLTIPITLGAVQMHNVRNLLEDEYKVINASAQKEISRQLDDKITEMKKLSSLIMNNSQIQAYIQRNTAVSLNERYTLKDIAEFFKSSSSFSDVSSCYLYINNDDVIVTSDSVIPREYIQQTAFKGQIVQSLDFDKYINTYHPYAIEPIEDNQTGEIRLMLITSHPFASYLKPKATIFQIFSASVIKNTLSNVAIDDLSDILLVDGDGRIVSRKSRSKDNYLLDIENFNDEKGQTEAIINGEKCLVFYSSITVLPGYHCIMVVPLKLISQKTALISQNSFLFIIFSIVLGSLLSYFLIYQNYKPVKRIIKQISPYCDDSHRDAFEQISDTFKTVITNYNEWTLLWEQQKSFLQDKFMESAFQGGVIDSIATREILFSFGISFPGNLFCVLVMCPAQETGTKEKNQNAKKQLSLNGFEDWKISLPDSILLYWLEIDCQLAVLVNFNTDNFDTDYSDFCKKTSLWINNYSILTASSSIFGSLSLVNSCYQEAVEQLYIKRMDYLQSGVFPQSSFQQKGIQKNYGISQQQEDALVSTICLGDCQRSLKIFYDILKEKKFLQLRGTRYNSFVYGIINVIWKAVHQLSDVDKNFINQLTVFTNKFVQNFEKDGESAIAPLIDFICFQFQKNTDSKTQPLINKITDCININFMKTEFNVTCLSEMLGMNLSYLSKYFKANTGVGLHDYINRVRINKGKQLISEQSIPISKVAEMVGFDNLNSFIRVFKKYEFKTPGDYKIEQGEYMLNNKKQLTIV